jgi:hypothetical protein
VTEKKNKKKWSPESTKKMGRNPKSLMSRKNSKKCDMKYTNYTLNLDSEGGLKRGELATAMRGKANDLFNSIGIPGLEELLSDGYEISGTTPLITTWKNEKTGDSFTFTESILFHLIKR